MEIINFTTENSGERIDALLSHIVPELTRSAAVKLIESGNVLVNGQPIRKNYKCSSGDELQISLPEPESVEIVAQDIPLDVVFEDDDVIVINKPRGMVVHPAPGHPDGTLVNALLHHCGASLSGIGGEIRPGIVHRIDMDTSGLLIVAKNDFAHQHLSAQLSDHSLHRVYEAVVYGRVREDSGKVDAPIGRHPTDRKRMAITDRGGREAVTHYEVIERYNGFTHLRCRLETGRTHQIRVHMEKIGHPLVGDMVYGKKCAAKGLEGQCLHARELKFIHPRTNEQIHLMTELPEYFTAVLAKLGAPIG
ncbi:MAG: RluA family pseudouridine synthase [Oscillospiraceae bacterium]|nr:RluA family pseudouridine synthase [Oscillospiraceae bacterium]